MSDYSIFCYCCSNMIWWGDDLEEARTLIGDDDDLALFDANLDLVSRDATDQRVNISRANPQD